MKIKKIFIAIIIAIVMLTSTFIITTSAVGEGSFIVFGNDSSYQYKPYETWQEFIDNTTYSEFSYDEDYVFYNGRLLWIMPDNKDYVLPTDKILDTYYGWQDYGGFFINGVVDDEGDEVIFYFFEGECWKELISNTSGGLHPDQGFTCDETFVYYEGTVIAGVTPDDFIIHVKTYSLCEDHEIEDLSDHDEKAYCYHEGCLSCGYVNSQAHEFVYDETTAQCELCGYYYEEQHFEVIFGDTVYYFTFDELGIDESAHSWADVAAYFIDEDLGEYIIVTDESDVMYLHHGLYGDGIYHNSYILCNRDYTHVLSTDDVIDGGVYYVKLVNVTHDMVDIVFMDDTYCYYQRCSYCGYEIFQEHDFVTRENTVESCISGGTVTEECCAVGCGHIVEYVIEPTQHVYQKTIIQEPTCTENGLVKYYCNVCAYSYEADIVALGHDYAAATCTEPKTCKKCGETSGEALGHYFPDWYNIMCQRCGEWKWNCDTDTGTDDDTDNNDKWYDNLFGGGSSDDTEEDDLADKLEGLFDDFNDTLDKLLAVALTVLGVIGVLMLAPYVINFIKAIFK